MIRQPRGMNLPECQCQQTPAGTVVKNFQCLMEIHAVISSTSHQEINRQQGNPTVGYKSTAKNLKFQTKLIKIGYFKFMSGNRIRLEIEMRWFQKKLYQPHEPTITQKVCLQALWEKLWYREIQYSIFEIVRIRFESHLCNFPKNLKQGNYAL